jgi:hypothetical protein
MLDRNSQSATVLGYVEAINTLFWLCHFDIPVDLSDRANMCLTIILARETEENIARQQSTITQEMYSTMLDLANKSPIISLETIVEDWFTLIRCCAEYAQKTQSAIDKNEYPFGKHAVKAFIPTDWEFYNSKGSLICIHTLNSKLWEFQVKLKMTFRIQKNKQNSQSITMVAGSSHLKICPVQAAYRILIQAKRLNQPDSESMQYLSTNSVSNIPYRHQDFRCSTFQRKSSSSGSVQR